jgi:hypothetical protein
VTLWRPGPAGGVRTAGSAVPVDAAEPPDLVVAEVPAATVVADPPLEMIVRVRPFAPTAALAVLVALLLTCAVVGGALVYRSRPVTTTVTTPSAGTHGADAIGCPYQHACTTVSDPPPAMAQVLRAVLGAYPATGETTGDAGSGAVYLAVASARLRGDTVLVRAQCVPEGVVPGAPTVHTMRRPDGVIDVIGRRGTGHGCSVFAVYETRDAGRAGRAANAVAAIITDPRLALPA